MNTRTTRTKRRLRGFAAVSAAVLPGALLFGAGDLDAQTIWTGLERPKGLQLELHHPELDDFGPEAYGALTERVLFSPLWPETREDRPPAAAVGP